MKILITGGAGFIGSQLVKTCLERGYEVTNIDNLTYAGNLGTLSSHSSYDNYTFFERDITDLDVMIKTFVEVQPLCVLHLAAETHVDRSISSANNFINTNVLGTMNVLEAYRRVMKGDMNGSPRLLHVSTDEVFGSLDFQSNVKFSEKTQYDPRSPYSASKASSDHLVKAWHATYGLPAIVTNCSNNYGKYQNPEKFIPKTIISCIEGRPITVYGSGKNIRDWLHVTDHVNALLKVLELGKVGQSYCIGGNTELSNLSLANIICSVFDEIAPRHGHKYSDLIQHVTDRPGHDLRYGINNQKISDELNWSPSMKFEHGLRQTIEWYIANKDWWKPLISEEIY